MGIEKDTAFKFIGKNFLEVLFSLANLPDELDPSEIEEVSEELISLRIAQYRPDFVGKTNNMILMMEYESSYVGLSSKKRFHAYVALYDYEKNEENLDIIFCVITTKEESKIVEHKIGDTDSFKILIFNINDLDFEKIISSACDKIENQEVFKADELVELALTSLMPGTREGNINQFFKLSELMNDIIFEDDRAKISFNGLILLLSDIYFDKNDPLRKKIQGEFMEKVDCITEMREEQFNAGFGEGILMVARKLLSKGMSVEDVSDGTDLPISEVKKLLKEIKSSQ